MINIIFEIEAVGHEKIFVSFDYEDANILIKQAKVVLSLIKKDL
jgi:hypothetical protein